jgi:hypothetical protein
MPSVESDLVQSLQVGLVIRTMRPISMSKFLGILVAFIMLILVVGCGGGSSTPPPPPPNPASISPASASVPIGGTKQFTGTGFPGAITWTINPAIGTIDASGLYHAPATFPSPNNLTVTGTSGGTTANASASIVFPNDNAGAESAPIKLGTSGANALDVGTKVCCIGTLGSLWTRGAATVILSNNHVLARSDQATIGEAIQQPGQNACFTAPITVANLTAKAALTPAGTTQGRTGAAPSNTDSAVATIIAGQVDLAGTILDLGAAGSTSIAAAPPSSTVAVPSLGLAVAKSGRTTGLTCSTIGSINTNVQVAYETSCGSGVTNFNATFANQVVINGGSFSGSGDSGSLVVTSAQARPVALLFGGSTTDTVANPVQDVIAALSLVPIAGNPDHAVSCDPTANASSFQAGALSATTPLSASERQRVTVVQRSRAVALMKDPAISSVTVGASADSPEEGALVISASKALSASIPPVIDGVRTRLIFEDGGGGQPTIGELQISRATAVKEAHVAEWMGKPGIQGVGVSLSLDNPTETAISIYVVKGAAHPPIPAVIDGVRTRIFEGDRFKAF